MWQARTSVIQFLWHHAGQENCGRGGRSSLQAKVKLNVMKGVKAE